MPLFSFHRSVNGRRIKLATVELPDREASRDYGIGLAEEILRDPDTGPPPITSRIVIFDANGEDLDTIVSEAF